MDNLTRSLNEMIRHQRLAESHPAGSTLQEGHHREALRYRLETHKLDKQIKIIRLLIRDWVREN